MLISRKLFIYICCILFALITKGGQAASFSENFFTTTHRDGANTTAIWDTTQGRSGLPYSGYTFYQPSGIKNWGGQIKAIHYNGSSWMIGGNGAKLNEFDGSTWTNHSTSLQGYSTNRINAISYYNNLWLIGGAGKKLNSYNGSVFTDISGSMINWTNQDINAITSGNASQPFFLIVGNGGRINRYNGSAFTDLSGSAGYFANTTNAYAAAFNTTGNEWLIGGDKGRLSRYWNYTFYDLSAAFSSVFGLNQVNAIAWNGSYWLLGGSSSVTMAAPLRI